MSSYPSLSKSLSLVISYLSTSSYQTLFQRQDQMVNSSSSLRVRHRSNRRPGLRPTSPSSSSSTDRIATAIISQELPALIFTTLLHLSTPFTSSSSQPLRFHPIRLQRLRRVLLSLPRVIPTSQTAPNGESNFDGVSYEGSCGEGGDREGSKGKKEEVEREAG